jgi:hypothetical protein
MISPEAAFDCLFISLRLQGSFGNSAPGEIHLFAYLGCLLSLYRGRPASDWGYSFAGTRHGSPFSPAIDHALGDLLALGVLSSKGEYVVVGEEGATEYGELRRLSQNALREEYLEGACSSLLALPVGLIRSALSEEPMLRPSIKLGSTRALLVGPGLDVLHQQFQDLSNAIGVEAHDLLVPATVWLTFLSRGAKENLSS